MRPAKFLQTIFGSPATDRMPDGSPVQDLRSISPRKLAQLATLSGRLLLGGVLLVGANELTSCHHSVDIAVPPAVQPTNDKPDKNIQTPSPKRNEGEPLIDEGEEALV